MEKKEVQYDSTSFDIDDLNENDIFFDYADEKSKNNSYLSYGSSDISLEAKTSRKKRKKDDKNTKKTAGQMATSLKCLSDVMTEGEELLGQDYVHNACYPAAEFVDIYWGEPRAPVYFEYDLGCGGRMGHFVGTKMEEVYNDEYHF